MVVTTETEPPEPGEFLRDVRQGHVFVLPDDSAILGGLRNDTSRAVVISQSCDVVLPKRPTVIVASVVSLAGNLARQAALREVPQYIHLPMLGSDQFADLAWVRAVRKADLVGLDYSLGINLAEDESVRTFALAVGRWFSRFAFPDDVVPWLNPLIDLIREKYHRPASPLGLTLSDVVEFRVEAESWAVRPLSLVLHVIVKAGKIPTLDADSLDESSIARASNQTGLRPPPEIAQLLINANTSVAKATLWPLLAESLALQCIPKPAERTPTVDGAVSRIVAQLWEDDQFPLSKYRKSEMLDVEYLSEPHPL